MGANDVTKACWASSGNAAAGCAALEQSLRACMDAPVSGYLFSFRVGVGMGMGKYGDLGWRCVLIRFGGAETEAAEEEYD